MSSIVNTNKKEFLPEFKSFAKEIGLKYDSNTFFGLLVTIWFIINEIISILENIGRMGTVLPDFLKNVLAELKENINNKK